MSMWVCSRDHELCHPVRMSTSPGQGLGWGLFVICPQFRFDTDRVLCLLSREGKKAWSPTGGRGSVQPRSHILPASVLLPMTPDEKPVSPPGVPTWPRVQSCWYRERKSGEQAPGHQGLDEQMVASPPGLQRMAEPSQVKRGMRVGERCAKLGTTSPGINHWALRWGYVLSQLHLVGGDREAG